VVEDREIKELSGWGRLELARDKGELVAEQGLGLLHRRSLGHAIGPLSIVER
jgi:hypothetical protein